MWGVILGASILTWALCFPVRRILVWFGFWDVSNDRSCHAGRIIRGGGLAPTIVILLSLGLWGNSAAPQIGYVWVACLILLALINVTDDFRGLPIKVRLAGQLLVAVVSAWAILSEDWGIIEIAGGALLLMTLMNFFNFLDGINGLIPTQVVVITLGLILLGGNLIANEGIMACVIGGAALGFLPFNFPRASMFLGDVGSVMFGYSCGMLLLWQGDGLNEAGVWVWLLTVFIFFEGFIAIFRRMWNGEQWWTPHREHFYQRLVRSGWSHAKTVGLISCGQGIILLGLVLRESLKLSPAFLGVMTIIIWCIYGFFVEYQFRNCQDEARFK